MNEFFSFRRMITPVIIQVIFWIAIVVNVIFALVLMFHGGGSTLAGIVWLFLGPLLARVYCELLIVIFRINETLSDIRANTSVAAPPAPAPPPAGTAAQPTTN